MKLNVIKKIQENGKVSYYSIVQNEFNGKKTTYFLSVGFKKGTEPENTCTIDIKTMFFEVDRIDGDYAYLKRTDEAQDEPRLVARALLPESIKEGNSNNRRPDNNNRDRVRPG